MKRISSRAVRFFLLVILSSAAACGCAYRVGSSLSSRGKSICVDNFVNKTTKPQIEFETTSATLREFQRDGTLSVAAAGDADLIMETQLTHYGLEPLRYERNRPTTAREYRLTLTADVVVKAAATQKVVEKLSGLTGQTTFAVTVDLLSDEKTALPAAAKDLAHHIVEGVVEYW